MNQDKLSEQIWNQTSEWINGIGRVINELAQQLGVAAEHVYTVYTQQMFAEGLVNIIILVFCWVIAALFSVYFYKKYSNNEEIQLLWLLPIGFMFLVTLILIPLVTESILKMINPEYYTIQHLMELAKSLTQK